MVGENSTFDELTNPGGRAAPRHCKCLWFAAPRGSPRPHHPGTSRHLFLGGGRRRSPEGANQARRPIPRLPRPERLPCAAPEGQAEAQGGVARDDGQQVKAFTCWPLIPHPKGWPRFFPGRRRQCRSRPGYTGGWVPRNRGRQTARLAKRSGAWGARQGEGRRSEAQKTAAHRTERAVLFFSRPPAT